MTRRLLRAAWGEAQAKLNLGLAVTGRRPDGLHTLDSIFVRLALHDHLEVRFTGLPGGPDELEVRGDTRVPASDDLVLRAAARLRAAAGTALPGLHFRLEKDIPVAAGLGGGSADAAATLELAAGAWQIDLTDDRYAGLPLGLGADVPFCLSRFVAARVGGVGESVTPLPAPTTALGILLVTPPVASSTAAVFTELDHLEPRQVSAAGAAVSTLSDALAVGADAVTLAGLGATLRDANDLWPATERLIPWLGALRGGLEDRLDRPCLLTGSGPTLVALYPSPQDASRAAAELAAADPQGWHGSRIIATRTSAPGGTP